MKKGIINRKKATVLISVMLIIGIFISLAAIYKQNAIKQERQQKTLIESYLNNLKEGDMKEAVKKVCFTEAEREAGVPDVFCSAMEGYDYKYFNIKEIKKLNDSVYLANAIVNTNFDSKDKSQYIDVEFNPFIVVIDNQYKLAFIKEEVPKSLYEDLAELPYNYDDNHDYIVIE